MPITVSKLRSDIYKLLDQVLASDSPLEVELKGRRLIILPAQKAGKMARLVPHACLNCDPQDLVHLDWSGEWKNDLP